MSDRLYIYNVENICSSIRPQGFFGESNCAINTRTGSSEVIYFVIFFFLCVIKENCTLEFSIHLKFSSDTFIYLSYLKLGTDCIKQRIVLHQIRPYHIVFYCIALDRIISYHVELYHIIL